MNLSIDIAGIAALIVAGIALYKVFFTQKYDNTKSDAEAASSYADAAKAAAERGETAEKRCAERDEKIENLECEMAQLKQTLAVRDRYIAELISGIGRLTHQLQSHQLTPVWTPRSIDEIQ